MDINWIQYILVLAIVLINHSIRKLSTVVIFLSFSRKIHYSNTCFENDNNTVTKFSCWLKRMYACVYKALTAVIKLARVYGCVCVVILFGYQW